MVVGGGACGFLALVWLSPSHPTPPSAPHTVLGVFDSAVSIWGGVGGYGEHKQVDCRLLMLLHSFRSLCDLLPCPAPLCPSFSRSCPCCDVQVYTPVFVVETVLDATAVPGLDLPPTLRAEVAAHAKDRAAAIRRDKAAVAKAGSAAATGPSPQLRARCSDLPRPHLSPSPFPPDSLTPTPTPLLLSLFPRFSHPRRGAGFPLAHPHSSQL